MGTSPRSFGNPQPSRCGGNPGGYIEFSDGGPTPGEILAPAAFLGDWSSLDGTGILSWDHRIINRGTSINAILPLQASISGPGGSASFDTGLQATSTGWISATAPVAEAAWSLNSGTWLGLLSDVAELRVKIELVDNSDANDVHGIDNIALALSPVPEPSMLALFTISLFVLGFFLRSHRGVNG